MRSYHVWAPFRAFVFAVVLSSVAMATAADLAAEIAAGKTARVELTLSTTMRRIDTGVDETHRFCSVIPADVATADSLCEGLEVTSLTSKLTKGQQHPLVSAAANAVSGKADEGLAGLLVAKTELDVGKLKINFENTSADLGGFHRAGGLINGAVSADVYTLACDGLPANHIIHRGDRFHVAGDGPKAWRVVLEDTTANGSGVIAALPFWPAAPSGGWSDDAKILTHPETPRSIAATYMAYSASGRTAELRYTGALQDGSRVTWASPGYLFKDGLTDSEHVDLANNRLTLGVRPPVIGWTQPLALPYAGFGAAILFDAGAYYHTDSARPAGLDPGASDHMVIQIGRVFIPEQYRGQTKHHYIIANGAIALADGGSYGVTFDSSALVFTMFIHINSVKFEASTPAVPRLENWYSARFEFDTTANTLQGFLMNWSDRARPMTAGSATGSVTGAYTATATQLTIGADPPGNTLLFEGIVSQIAIGVGTGVLPADNDVRTALIRRRLTENDAGVTFEWSDDIDSTGDTWFAHPLDAGATPTSVAEATEITTTEAAVAHGLQGGVTLAGTRPPVSYGLAKNVHSSAVASGVQAFSDFLMWSNSENTAGPLTGVFDGATVVALDTSGQIDNLMDFFQTAVGAGKYTTNAQYIRFGTAPSAAVTCDTWGESFWDHGMHYDGSATWADSNATFSSILTSGYTLSGWVFTTATTADGRLFTSEFASLNMLNILGEAQLTASLETTSTTDTAVATTPFEQPYFWAVTADEIDASNVELKIYINGILKNTTAISGQLSTPTTDLTFGIQTPATFLRDTITNENQLHDSVLTAAEVFELFVDPDFAPTGGAAEHRWSEAGVDVDPAVWPDTGATGGQDLVVTSGEWNKPVPVGNMPCIAAHALVLRAGMTDAQQDLSAAVDLPDEPRGLPMAGDQAVQDVIDLLRMPEGWIVWDGEAGLATWTAFEDLTTATATVTINDDRALQTIQMGARSDPPWAASVGFDLIGLVQPDPLLGADDERRGFVQKPIRYQRREIAGATNTYLLSSREARYDAAFVSLSAAATSAASLATKLGRAPRKYTLVTSDWLTATPAGTIIAVVAPGVEGGEVRGVVVESKLKGGRGGFEKSLILLGVAV